MVCGRGGSPRGGGARDVVVPGPVSGGPVGRQVEAGMSTEITELWLPATFWADHVNRSNDYEPLVAAEVDAGKRGILVRLTDEQLSDLASDADYYVYCGSEMGSEYFGLVSSARATLGRLRKAGKSFGY